MSRDFRGTFSVLGLRGNGYTGGILVVYEIGNRADITIKYLFTRYSGRSEIGTGRDTIAGPRKSFGGIQLDIKM